MTSATSGTATAAPTRVRAWESLTYRDYRVFWIGALISNTGGWMQRIAIPFVMWDLTGSAAWVGWAGLASLGPMVVLGPIGGVMADRYPRRTLLMITQTYQAAVALGLAALWAGGLVTRETLLAMALLMGIGFGLNGPTWQAFVSELVPRRALLNAVTLNSTQFNAARALGPAIGGVVLAVWGPGATFLINAISFGAVLVALAMIRSDPAVASPTGGFHPVRELRGAIGYVADRPGIIASFVTVGALGLLSGPLVQLLVVFKDEVFGVGDAAYGMMAAALGFGAIVAAPFVAGRGSGIRRSTLTFGGVVVNGLALMAFAATSSLAVGLVALLVAGAGWLALASTLNTTIQVQVTEAVRGKVLAAYLMALTAAMPLGAVVQGVAADVFGPRPTVAVAGALFVLVGFALKFGTGLLPHMDDAPGVPAEPA